MLIHKKERYVVLTFIANCVSVMIMFDLWMFRIRFDIFVLFVNFIFKVHENSMMLLSSYFWP
jgi:hypothetical protein